MTGVLHMKIIRSSTDAFLYVITHDKSHLMDCGPPDESHLADSSCARISRIFWLLRNGETFFLATTDLFSLFAAILVANQQNFHFQCLIWFQSVQPLNTYFLRSSWVRHMSAIWRTARSQIIQAQCWVSKNDINLNSRGQAHTIFFLQTIVI